jgi:thioredoxin-related protein
MKNLFYSFVLLLLVACGSSSKNIATGPPAEVVESNEAPQSSITIGTFTGADPSGVPQKKYSNDDTRINWLDFEKAIDLNAEEKKYILIDVYTDWCSWCKKMDATTFNDPAVIEYINENFYAIKMDAESKEAIAYREVLYESKQFGNKMYNELAVNLLSGKMSFPSFVVLSKRETKKGVINGYQNSTEFLLRIKGLIK